MNESPFFPVALLCGWCVFIKSFLCHFRSWGGGEWPTLHTGNCSWMESPRFSWSSKKRAYLKATVRMLSTRVAPPSSPLPPPLSLHPSLPHKPHPSSPHNCHKGHISHNSPPPPHNHSARQLRWYTFRWERTSTLNSNTFDTGTRNSNTFDTAALNSAWCS